MVSPEAEQSFASQSVRSPEPSRPGALMNTPKRKTVSSILGDTSAARSDYDILVQRSQLVESCMKGKGYRGQ